MLRACSLTGVRLTDRMAHFPDDATGDVLRDIYNHGVDFTVPHVVEFALLFPARESADRCAAEVRKLGRFDVSVLENDVVGGFDVLAKQPMLLDYDAIDGAERTLALIATAAGGRFDGWGVLVD